MNKEMYISLVPIENADIKKFILDFVNNVNITNNVYRKQRFKDTIENIKSKDLNINDYPMFIPNVAVKIDNDANFRLTVLYPIYDKADTNGMNSKIISTPWREDVKYYLASREEYQKAYSNYIGIVCGENCYIDYVLESNEDIKDIIRFCEDKGIEWRIVKDSEGESLFKEFKSLVE